MRSSESRKSCKSKPGLKRVGWGSATGPCVVDKGLVRAEPGGGSRSVCADLGSEGEARLCDSHPVVK